MVYVLFILLAFLSLLPNLWLYPFKGEESLRVLVAFEMFHQGSLLQPTLLGEPYFNKPPLFNWLIILFSYIIPWSELTVRAVSLTSLLLSTLNTFLIARVVLRDREFALLASLVFLTFGNILFFYGYLGEIDITLTFFVSSVFLSLYLSYLRGADVFLITAGLFSGLAFLLKGFPAYGFYGISLLVFTLYSKSLRFVLSKWAVFSHLLAVLIPFVWFLSLPEPFTYLKTLFHESFSRVSSEEFSRLKHAVKFLLLTFKDTLPWSFLSVLALYVILKRKEQIRFKPLYLTALLFSVNYLPYLLSNSAGRYILPLYPLLAVMFAYLIGAVRNSSFKRLVYATLSLVIFLRLLYGLVFFPYYANRENSEKRIALDIHSLVGNSKLACNCVEHKSVCLYLGLWRGESLKTLRKTPDAEYLIECGQSSDGALKEYKGGRIKLIHLKS